MTPAGDAWDDRCESGTYALHLQREQPVRPRYRFGATFPGDISAKSAVDDPALGYLPMHNPAAFELFNPTQRELTALALSRNGSAWPDVICLQEI